MNKRGNSDPVYFLRLKNRLIIEDFLNTSGSYSIILPPCVVAFRAAEKPDLTFICRPQLAKPPDCEVILTLGAFYLDGGHGLCLTFLFDDDDLVFAALDPALHLIGVIDLPDIPAFPAFQLASRRYEHGLALRTEHRYSMRKHRRLTLLSRKIRHGKKFFYLSGTVETGMNGSSHPDPEKL